MREIVDANIRGIPLPVAVHGCVLPNRDGTFDVYYNSRLGREQCMKAIAHELEHIRRGHLYDCRPVWINETEAEKNIPH